MGLPLGFECVDRVFNGEAWLALSEGVPTTVRMSPRRMLLERRPCLSLILRLLLY